MYGMVLMKDQPLPKIKNVKYSLLKLNTKNAIHHMATWHNYGMRTLFEIGHEFAEHSCFVSKRIRNALRKQTQDVSHINSNRKDCHRDFLM